MSSSSSQQVRTFNPPSNPSLAETYSQISIVPLSTTKRLISFAGQTGTTPKNTPQANAALSFAEQIRIALHKVDLNLEAVGAQKSDIVMVRPYVVKLSSRTPEEIREKDEVYLHWWRSTEENRLPPPDSLLGVDSLWSAETLFEIEVQCVADIV